MKKVLSVGELNEKKNHEMVFRDFAKHDRKNIVYVICGRGDNKEYLENLAKELGMEDRLVLAGFRADIAEIYKCCDIFAFPSKREGLPVSVMEAMSSGLPCVVSRTRGNTDLIKNGETGFLCEITKVDDFAQKIQKVINEPELCEKFVESGLETIKTFEIDNVVAEMKKIYEI